MSPPRKSALATSSPLGLFGARWEQLPGQFLGKVWVTSRGRDLLPDCPSPGVITAHLTDPSAPTSWRRRPPEDEARALAGEDDLLRLRLAGSLGRMPIRLASALRAGSPAAAGRRPRRAGTQEGVARRNTRVGLRAAGEIVERRHGPKPTCRFAMACYIRTVGSMDGATAAGGRSCCLSSENTATECWRHQMG